MSEAAETATVDNGAAQDQAATTRCLAPIADRRMFVARRGKVPYGRNGRALSGSFASPALQTQLMTLAEAWQTAERFGLDGVGIAFYPGCGVVGFDFDKCIGPDGQIMLSPVQRAVLRLIPHGSCAELSMSGTGMHAFALGNAETLKANGIVELFGNKNFIALTGRRMRHPITQISAAAVAKAGALVRQAQQDAKTKPNIEAAPQRDAIPPAPDRVTLINVNAQLPAGTFGSADPEPRDKVLSALYSDLPPKDRDTWMRLVWAAKDGGLSEDDVRTWSAQDADKFSEVGFANVWNSQDGGVTVATLYAWAKENGWRWHPSAPTASAEGKAVERVSQGAHEPPLAERDALARLNAKYFIAPDGAGKPAIWCEYTDPETSAPRVVPIGRAEFALMHENDSIKVTVGDAQKSVPVALWWLRHKNRRQYPGGVALIPEGPTPQGVYNLWRGFGVKPAGGDVAPMLDHISMLCSGDTNLIAYVIGWLAFCVQRPGSRPEVAVVFQGDEGTGKGTLFRLMTQIFGPHGLHITQNSHLVGHFNAHLRWSLFVFVDEGYWAGDKSAEGVLKGLVTEPTLAIEVKGRDVFTAQNRISLAMATNHAYAVPSGANARRWLVVQVPNTKVRDFAYFETLNCWIENSGASAWLHHLLHVDLSGFNVRAVPSTAALDRQKIASLSPLDRWVLESLEQGTALAGSDDWSEEGAAVVCSAGVTDFADYCRRAGGRWAQADARVIGNRLNQLFECGPARVGQADRRRSRAWNLPGLSQARTMAGRAFGLQHHTWSGQ